MELRHLRYFVSIAEHGSVRVAAERLHISQPAISRQIHDLEDELGTPLFIRMSKGVELTPVGSAFLVRARAILSDVIAAKELAHRMAVGLSGHLSFGFVENATWDGVLPRLFRQFKESAVDVDLTLLPMSTLEQLERLQAGTLDGAFIYPFTPLGPEYDSYLIAMHDVVVAVPNMWKFDRPPQYLSDLADCAFITFPRDVYPVYYDLLVRHCSVANGPLHSVQAVTTEAAILSLVSSGMGAAIVNSANRFRPPALVDFITLKDLSIPLPLTFVTRRDNKNPALATFSARLCDR